MVFEYFVAIEPSNVLYEKIFNTKKEIFKLYGEQKYLFDLPHCTLYLSVANNLEEISNILSEISNQNFEIEINVNNQYILFDEDKISDGQTSIGIYFDEKSQIEIIKLQEKIVLELNKLRVGTPNRYQKVNLNGVLKESLDIYGFPFVCGKNKKNILIAHISFCHFKSKEKLEDFKKIIKMDIFAGKNKFDKIVLYKLNKDDSCEKIISYPLKRSNKR